MSLPIGIGIYFICWWLAFFMMLPFGVRTQADTDSIEPGTADSAPLAPQLWMKALAATILSALIFGGVYLVITYRLITLDSFPMLL